MEKKMGNEIDRHLEKLVREIGPRPTGSQANLIAMEYIEKEMGKSGFSVQRQEFDCINWIPAKAKLIIGGKEIMVKGADYTLPCKIEEKIHCIISVEQLEDSKIMGEIVFLYGEIASEPLMPKNFPFWNPEEHKKIISLLEEKNPGAVIFESSNEESLVHLIEDGDFSIPCAVVPRSERGFILKNENSSGRLEIESSRIPAKGANIIGRRKGKKPKIVVSAHLDTKPFTPGALDNAAGIAALLALANTLGIRNPKREIELVAFNGEDYFSNPGEVIYFEDNLSKPQEYFLGINVDGIGYRSGETGFSYFEVSEEIRKTTGEIKKDFPEIVEIDPWPQGDHMLFVLRGIPALALTSTEVFGLLEKIIHTSKDNLELIDSRKIIEIIKFLFCLVSKI